MKYIILNKLIYRLDNKTYHELNLLEISYRHARKKASDMNDDMLAYDEYNDLNNYLTWIKENLKPISGERDNYDLDRYDNVCHREHVDDNEQLPF